MTPGDLYCCKYDRGYYYIRDSKDNNLTSQMVFWMIIEANSPLIFMRTVKLKLDNKYASEWFLEFLFLKTNTTIFLERDHFASTFDSNYLYEADAL